MADEATPLDPNAAFDDRARFHLAEYVILQFVVIIGVMLALFTVKIQIPDSQIIITAEVNFVMLMLGYYFGSSSGSSAKDKILGKINGDNGTH